MSKRPLQVSPFLAAAQSTSPEVLSDFQIWSSSVPGLSDALGLSDIENLCTVLISIPRTMSSKVWDRKGVQQYSTYLQDQMNLSPQVSPCLS